MLARRICAACPHGASAQAPTDTHGSATGARASHSRSGFKSARKQAPRGIVRPHGGSAPPERRCARGPRACTRPRALAGAFGCILVKSPPKHYRCLTILHPFAQGEAARVWRRRAARPGNGCPASLSVAGCCASPRCGHAVCIGAIWVDEALRGAAPRKWLRRRSATVYSFCERCCQDLQLLRYNKRRLFSKSCFFWRLSSQKL